jgi:hypothetical protein
VDHPRADPAAEGRHRRAGGVPGRARRLRPGAGPQPAVGDGPPVQGPGLLPDRREPAGRRRPDRAARPLPGGDRRCTRGWASGRRPTPTPSGRCGSATPRPARSTNWPAYTP